MKILVAGGTRYFGIYLVEELIKQGYEVTIATRGKTADGYGTGVQRIVYDRSDAQSIKRAFEGKHFDLVYDNIAYASGDVKRLLDVISCGRYIMVSSASVYDKHINMREEDFEPIDKDIVWGDRKDFSYDEGKRQAEYALCNYFNNVKAVSVRYPFVIGKDDYTKRFQFYIDHAVKGIPMYVDNISYHMSFIRSDEAGRFLAYLAGKDFEGAVNGSTAGTISIEEILNYVTEKTGKTAILSDRSEAAPYNGEGEYSINTEKAERLGFEFTNLKDWIYELIDYYIEKAAE